MKKIAKRLLVILLVVCMMTGVLTIVAACKKKGDTGTYTYRVATSSLPTSWNIHTYQANDATTILDYTEDGFYSFDYNDTKDGYKWVLAMATAFPQDVTSTYRSQAKWGIGANDEWRAIRVTIRDDLYFDNGDHITSKDFRDSIELLLNPKAANFRADSLYGGQFSIVGAESYAKAGGYNYSAFVSSDYVPSEYVANSSLTKDKDGYLQYTKDGNLNDVVLSLSNGSSWGASLEDYAGNFTSYVYFTDTDGTKYLQYRRQNDKGNWGDVLILREAEAKKIADDKGLWQYGEYTDDGFTVQLKRSATGSYPLDEQQHIKLFNAKEEWVGSTDGSGKFYDKQGKELTQEYTADGTDILFKNDQDETVFTYSGIEYPPQKQYTWYAPDGTTEVERKPVFASSGNVVDHSFTINGTTYYESQLEVYEEDLHYYKAEVSGNKVSKGAEVIQKTFKEQVDGKDADVKYFVLKSDESSKVTAVSGLTAWTEYSEDFKALYDAADDDGYVKLTEDLLENLMNVIAQLQGYENAEEYAADSEKRVGANGDINYAYAEWQEMALLGRTWANFSMDDVGVVTPDDYTIDFIIEKPLKGFYLTYNLASSMYLVNTKLYKEHMGESQGAYTNDYGTGVDSYVGFGPYKLTEFVSGNVARFAKNEYWYGYKDAEKSNVTLYQTTNIEITQVTDANTRLNMFLTGQTDSYGLQATDLKNGYAGGDYTYYTDGDSTFFLALNPSADGLEKMEITSKPSKTGNKVVKRVLLLKEFRQALSFSLDRSAYIAALDPASSVATALYSNMIVSDPDNSIFYRDTEQAKDVILAFWGLTDDVGTGKTYATKDEAIASITGYDPTGAKELFRQAYTKAKAAGYIPDGDNWEVQLIIGQPGNGGVAYYNDGYELLKKTWEEAVKGTPFEGKLVITQSQPLGSTTFSTYLKNNQVDVLFGVGWTGSTLDPYSLMEAYVSPNYQYDPGWDTKSTDLDVTIGGTTYRASVYDWGYKALQGTAITATILDSQGKPTTQTKSISAGTEDDYETRLAILAAVEGAVLEQYDMIPVHTDASATLKGMRIKYYTEEYIFGMGRGGIKYMTYTMNDAEWSEFVQKQGGTLNYK